MRGLSIEFLSWENMRCLITGIAVNFIPIASHRPVRYLRVYARCLSIIPLTNSGLYEDAVDENASAFKTVASANTIKMRVNMGRRRLGWYFLWVWEYKASLQIVCIYYHVLLLISWIILDILIINYHLNQIYTINTNKYKHRNKYVKNIFFLNSI